MKLHQVIAVETGEKTRARNSATSLYKLIQKPALFNGLVRTYQPRDAEGVVYPPESTEVQYRVSEVVKQFVESQSRLWDLTATKDVGNTVATATLKFGGAEIPNLPVPYLLFLEQRLNDLHTFVENLPLLNKSQKWDFDEDNRLYRSAKPFESIKTQKQQAALVKYEATEHHPAQTEVITTDVVQGTWTQVDFSGAIPEKTQKDLLDRINDLRNAVKVAREEANATEVDNQQVAQKLFDYIFGAAGMC